MYPCVLHRSAVPRLPTNRVVVRAAPAANPAKATGTLGPPAKRLKAEPAAASPSVSDSSAGGGALAGLLGDYGSDSDSVDEGADDIQRGEGEALLPAEEGGDMEGEKNAAQVAEEEPVPLAGANLTLDRQALEVGRIQSVVLNEEEAEVLLDYE